MQNNHTRSATIDRVVTLNRVLDEALSAGLAPVARLWTPAIDIVEQKDAYVLYAELPGVDSSQIDMSFEKSVLTLRGEKRSAVTDGQSEEIRVHAAERAGGKFERAVRLPEFVDAERISARFTNGLLVVTVPKAKAAQARRIEITSPAAVEG